MRSFVLQVFGYKQDFNVMMAVDEESSNHKTFYSLFYSYFSDITVYIYFSSGR